MVSGPLESDFYVSKMNCFRYQKFWWAIKLIALGWLIVMPQKNLQNRRNWNISNLLQRNVDSTWRFSPSFQLKNVESTIFKQNQGIYEIFHCLTELGLQKKMPKQTQNDTIVPQNKNSKKKKKKSFCSI